MGKETSLKSHSFWRCRELEKLMVNGGELPIYEERKASQARAADLKSNVQ